jgi:hypothetical protein
MQFFGNGGSIVNSNRIFTRMESFVHILQIYLRFCLVTLMALIFVYYGYLLSVT